MTNRRDMEKLAELRAKTDRQLIALIDSTLARARRYAQILPCEAQRAHAEAATLLAVVAPQDRIRLARELSRIDEIVHIRTLAAC